MSDKISKWLIPSRYYVSFPYGVYQPWSIYKHRKRISHRNPFFLSSNGKTIKDGEYLGFTFDAEEYKTYVADVKQSCTGGDRGVSSKERWSSRFFGLDKIFGSAIINKEQTLEIPWYHRIDSWEGLHGYLASDESKEVKRPSDTLFKKSLYKKVGEQE